MAQVVGSLARSEQYLGVDFARVDLEACPVCAAVDGAALRAGLIWRALSGAGRQACDSLCADVPLVSCRSYAGEINRGDA